MEETINRLLNIDNKAKNIIYQYQEKKNNLDYFISEEIAKRKKEIDSKYKYRIDFKKNEFENKLNQKKFNMNEIKNKGIEELRASYRMEKTRLINQIVNSIISGGE